LFLPKPKLILSCLPITNTPSFTNRNLCEKRHANSPGAAWHHTRLLTGAWIEHAAQSRRVPRLSAQPKSLDEIERELAARQVAALPDMKPA
jgi:hypothetical protein